ncbi:hypothetical protein GCM10027294_16480 [Marinactinospora endophytica]
MHAPIKPDRLKVSPHVTGRLTVRSEVGGPTPGYPRRVDRRDGSGPARTPGRKRIGDQRRGGPDNSVYLREFVHKAHAPDRLTEE